MEHFSLAYKATKTLTFDYGIGVSGSSLEQLQFITVAPEPALYVAGNFTAYNSSTEVGTLTKLKGAESADPTRQLSQTIGGKDAFATEVAKQAAILAAAEANKDAPTDTPVVHAETTASDIAADPERVTYE